MPTGIPLVVWASSLAPLLAIATVLAGGWRLRAGQWLVVGCTVSLAGDALSLMVAGKGGNNQWVAYLAAPLLFGSFLLALAWMQETRLERHAVRVAAVLLGLSLIGLAMLVEVMDNFSRFAIPLGALLVFAVALWTLVRAGLQGEQEFRWRGAWLWIPLGLALYSGVTAAYFPFAAVFAPTDRELVLAVFKLKSILVVLSFVLMAWGIVCQVRETSSGHSSLLSSSPSGSS
jgi:hypothetical protein